MATSNFSRSYASAARKGFFWILVLVVVVLGLWHFFGHKFRGGFRTLPAEPRIAESSEPIIITPKASEPIQKTAEPIQSVAAVADKTPAGQPIEAVSQVVMPSAPSTPAALPVQSASPAAMAAAQPAAAPTANAPAVSEIADFENGMAACGAKNYIQARDLLSRAVQKGLDSQRDAQARETLNKVADQWLFSRNVFDGDSLCQNYKIAQGELLAGIGKKFDVPHTFFMKINGVNNPSKLRAGEMIKVVQGPFRAVVERSKFRMTVYLGSAIARTYRVGLGGTGRETPVGLWVVQVGKKQINPAWTDPDTGKMFLPDDPENPLGERWVGLQGVEGDAVGRTGFGIHGTIKPDEIGKAVSRGCVRLLNPDAEEVYDMLTEGKSQVRIIE